MNIFQRLRLARVTRSQRESPLDKPIIDEGLTWRNLAEDFVGKTIATSEMYRSRTPGSPQYWFITFTNGSRVIVLVCGDRSIGVSKQDLSHVFSGNMKEFINQCPFFFNDEIVKTLENLWAAHLQERKQQWRDQAVLDAANLERLHFQGLRGVKGTLHLEFPDGEVRDTPVQVQP